MRTAEYTVRLAQAMGVPVEDLPHLRRGALLHDIGKMAIPDDILRKPGPLNDEEWKVMRQHPGTARDWLTVIEFIRPAFDFPYSHHEHWDGSGYPQGLAGEAIPRWARIFTIVDVWDAMGSDRPYRKAIPQDEILGYLKTESGRLLDPQVTEAFFDLHFWDSHGR